jgi:hypothetical protein
MVRVASCRLATTVALTFIISCFHQCKSFYLQPLRNSITQSPIVSKRLPDQTLQFTYHRGKFTDKLELTTLSAVGTTSTRTSGATGDDAKNRRIRNRIMKEFAPFWVVLGKIFRASYFILVGWVLKLIVRRWLLVGAWRKFNLAGGKPTIMYKLLSTTSLLCLHCLG